MTIGANILYIFTLPIAIFVYSRGKNFDVQYLILLASMGVMTPVIFFENILYLDQHYSLFEFSYSLTMMRFTFLLGILGYLFYNIHLLTVEDLPAFPISILSILAGFAMGAMVISAQLDTSNTIAPIGYNPIQGGIIFILSLMIFNLIGFSGFTFYQYRKGQRISTFENLIAIILFTLSPIVIFMLRILNFTDLLPFNFIFFLPSVTFFLNNVSMILGRYRYQISYDINSIYILDLNSDIVIAGYSKEHKHDELKVTGMAFLAINSIIQEISHNRSDNPIFGANYGNVIISTNRELMIVTTYYSGGRKIGKYLQGLILRSFRKNRETLTTEGFKKILDRYLYLFKPNGVKIEEVFFTD